MSFMQHLQSSIILGTKMTHPEEEHFHRHECKEIFLYIKANKISKIQALIEAGTDPDTCEHEHLNALSYAVKNSKHASIQTLLSYGCDLNLKDCFGFRALDYAEKNNDAESIELLLRYGAMKSSETSPQVAQTFNETDIFEAALTGNLHALRFYHQEGQSLHTLRSNKISLLHLCLEGNNLSYLFTF